LLRRKELHQTLEDLLLIGLLAPLVLARDIR
jgi:hypothetical protein